MVGQHPLADSLYGRSHYRCYQLQDILWGQHCKLGQEIEKPGWSSERYTFSIHSFPGAFSSNLEVKGGGKQKLLPVSCVSLLAEGL